MQSPGPDYTGINKGPSPMRPNGFSSKPMKTPTLDRNQELFDSMTQRIGQLEKINKSLKLEVREKSQKIGKLEDEVELLKSGHGGGSSNEEILTLKIEKE